MNSDPIISVRGVGKIYRIWDSPAARLVAPLQEAMAGILPESSALPRRLRASAARRYRDFHALQDISFEVRPGESVGIVGRNGSGKSTLLQIIAGTLRPTSGHARVKGRIAALLELGSGFNPDFTGRENVHLSGAVLGLSREQMDARFGDIADFADIGDFIDQPVRTYSSGMQLRLAFAVQSMVEPDVLIVDEALSVGDAPFQAKCFARIKAIQSRGCSILFVSHDVSTVRALCSSAICLSRGKIHSIGSAKAVCDDYQLLCMREQGIKVDPLATDPGAEPVDPVARFHEQHGPRNPDFTRQAARQRAGSGTVRLLDCYIADRSDRPVSVVEYNEPVQICWLVEAAETVKTARITLGITIKSLKGVELLSGTDKEQDLILNLAAGQRALIRMPYSFPLRGDRYYFSTSLFRFPGDRKFLHGTINFDESELLDLVEYCCHFEVNWNRTWSHYGPVQLDSKISITPLSLTT